MSYSKLKQILYNRSALLIHIYLVFGLFLIEEKICYNCQLDNSPHDSMTISSSNIHS